jgi:hypothetical protein
MGIPRSARSDSGLERDGCFVILPPSHSHRSRPLNKPIVGMAT